jgi:hypothetical protein
MFNTFLPQLDVFTFVNQLNNLFLFLFCFYSFFVWFFLPLLAQNLKIRRLIAADLHYFKKLNPNLILKLKKLLSQVTKLLAFASFIFPKILNMIIKERLADIDKMFFLRFYLPRRHVNNWRWQKFHFILDLINQPEEKSTDIEEEFILII